MKTIISASLLIFPWRLRRLMLIVLFGYEIHPSARIGFSIVYPDRLEMAKGSRIGTFTICKGLSLLKMGEHSSIGNFNWITAFPANDKRYFMADTDRRPELIIGDHAAVTTRHYIDCTNTLSVGSFTTIAGLHSQILTHSIDVYQSRQSSEPITIGEYCFVGTGCIILGKSALPNYSVLGAGSVLNTAYTESHSMYAGTPARFVKSLPKDIGYFQRTTGHVY
jgi:acetyltransferase-like isoleucine patch superfamily enzyme